MAPRFLNAELQDAVTVGAARPDSVRLWMRTSTPGEHRVRWWPESADDQGRERVVEIADDPRSDYTKSFEIPGDGTQLQPLTRYRFRITSAQNDRLIGGGRFETTPADPSATPESFSFAIMSCNQPFDSKGRVRADAREMLRATKSALDEHDCKFLLMMGDQMYSDMPFALSLFDKEYFAETGPPGRDSILDCTVDEVRHLYQKRYRHFGGLPELRTLVSNFPTYTIIDDHDIVDNWGSDPSHRSDKWRAVGEGARWAYYDYQAAHLMSSSDELPRSFHYQIHYGHTSFFVMDLRSERWVDKDDGQLFSRDQEQDFENFLQQSSGQKVLFVVVSVPPVHLPRYLAAAAARLSQGGEDFSDRWSSLAHVDDRDRFLKRIRQHRKDNPQQRLILLAGDIHVGCAHKLQWDDGTKPVYQLISSGITNRVEKPIQIGARLLMRLNRRVNTLDGNVKSDVRRLAGVNGRTKNPYAALNVGVVQVSSDGSDRAATIEYFLYGHDGSEPVCVFQSHKL